jgi:rod shape-determining protein MreC
MAPPKNRRPGFSRRAQFGLFIGYVAAIAGMVVAVLLLVIAVVDPRGFQAIKGAALDATTPVSSAGRSVVDFFAGIGDGVGNYFRAGSQNAELRSELAEARRELVRRQALELENRRLHALLGLARQATDEVAITRVVSSSFDSPRRLATLSAGSSSGIEPGQPVRSADGLIGRVLETGRWASRVLLVTDGASSVPVMLPRDGTPAIAVGRGDGTIELRTLEVGQNPFRRGDVLITSGIGGVFPPNIPVARVTRIEGDTAIAQPTADPARSDFAIVERIYQRAATGPLDAAPPPTAAPPVAGPAPAPQTPARRQTDPRYQPGLQQQQPGAPAPQVPQAPAGPPR